jgi:hypothetical protein
MKYNRRKTFRRKYSKTRSHRKNSRKSRRLISKGGQNIGANCSDPNYSIFNTNFLKLFPYKA